MRLSDSREVLLRLRWLAILSGLLKKTQVAVTTQSPIRRVKDASSADRRSR